MKSLSQKLTLFIVACVVAGLSIFFVINYNLTKNTVVYLYDNTRKTNLDTGVLYIDEYFKNRLSIVSKFASELGKTELILKNILQCMNYKRYFQHHHMMHYF
ncbi:hypothetical protein [Campylobacter sputorum]|uniref:hypothetical protein n=1 Tax=Campylobacter sputorum TaxID=206 RepID=UPI00053BFF28|nr:hypothetical protein [Campylobacter sputorum]